MSSLWIVGRPVSDPCFGALSDLALSAQHEGCDAAVIFVEGKGGNDLSTLNDSVERMHEALASIKNSSVKRLMVVTGFSSLTGRRWKQHQATWQSNLGVSLESVDGMGSLIAEILAKSAALGGMEVLVLRQDEHDAELLGRWIKKATSLSAAEYTALHDQTIPDLDGWVVMNHDPSGEFTGAIDALTWLQ